MMEGKGREGKGREGKGRVYRRDCDMISLNIF
jgi:hypothetical protein